MAHTRSQSAKAAAGGDKTQDVKTDTKCKKDASKAQKKSKSPRLVIKRSEPVPLPSPLLSLPAEVKKRIWAFAAVDHQDPVAIAEKRQRPALLDTCHEIRDEAAAFFQVYSEVSEWIKGWDKAGNPKWSFECDKRTDKLTRAHVFADKKKKKVSQRKMVSKYRKHLCQCKQRAYSSADFKQPSRLSSVTVDEL